MSSTRSGKKELGLKLVSLEKKISHMPKRPLMVGEKKDILIGYPFKMLLEETLTQHRNEMMDIFAQILQLPTCAAPFKVQIKFYIPIFQGQIDVDVVEK
jgi:hypothetical protein